ncbi:hypothetical protein CDAR_549831 [Caerostris darwini]|uniref:Uncharacterized protein n=1 Tax=Caerostris darwini TaxID=1538125 RepID=A0AAV4V2E9_9ARAC|nr:hypothetical protein CDAR_549831 [Caerostris darwini]
MLFFPHRPRLPNAGDDTGTCSDPEVSAQICQPIMPWCLHNPFSDFCPTHGRNFGAQEKNRKLIVEKSELLLKICSQRLLDISRPAGRQPKDYSQFPSQSYAHWQ